VKIGKETHRVDTDREGDPYTWLMQIGRETHIVNADREGDPHVWCR